jgi:hypothetical protein
MSNRGYTLDADSMRLLSKLVRESGLINKDNRIARIVDSWPTCAPARVTEEITARDGDTLGKGIVHVLVAQNVVDDNDTYEIAKQSELDPVDIPVFSLFENDAIPVGREGYVIQDQRGAHWWVESDSTNLVRFTLTASLAASGTATASTTPDSESITVTDWAGNPGESGDKGIAWKDGSTYWVVEIKNQVDPTDVIELFRFTLTADLAVGGTATATTTPATTTITVTDWAGNPAKSGSKGVAWKDGSTYWVIEIERPGPQFIMCKLSSGGYSFGGASGTTFNVTDIAGVDAPWTGASTIEVENPLKIKVWMTTCLIKCQFNQATGDWEVIAATQEHVLHGVRINETCVFQQLTYNGAENWNAPTDWDSRLSTTADWVTSVYIIDGSLVYDKRCQEGVVIADLTDCETPPEPPPE